MIKIKQNREYFLNLYQQLSHLGSLKGVKFSFTISKNKEILEPLLKKIREMAKIKPEYAEYEADRLELNQKYTLKDDKGKAVIKDEKYQIDEKQKELFDKEMAELKEKHKQAIEERENQSAEITEFVKEEIELKLISIPLSIVPKDITVDQMDILSKLIQN